MNVSMEWLRGEAVNQGLTQLTEGDLAAIKGLLESAKGDLRRKRPQRTEGLETPYTFMAARDDSGTEDSR